MSCVFRALPRLIPQVMLTAPPASKLLIISPWIYDVEIQPPILGSSGRWIVASKVQLSFFIAYLVEHLDLETYFFLRKPDKRTQSFLRQVKRLTPSEAIHIIDADREFTHAKGIVTNRLILHMSANLIPTSLYRNIETCSLSKNSYSSVKRYADMHLRTRI